MERLRTAYKEFLIAVVPVILIALLARLAMGTFSWAEIFANKSSLEAVYISQSDDVVTTPEARHNLYLEVENRSNVAWEQEGNNAVYLLADKVVHSPLYVPDSTWVTDNKIGLFEKEVKPGETGHFKFTIKSYADIGEYEPEFVVVDNNLKEIKGLKDISWKVNVQEPRWSFELVSQSENPTVIRDDLLTLQARFKNTGNTVWQNHGEHLVAIAEAFSDDDNPFYIENRWLDEKRLAVLDESFVEPGEEGTFTFDLKAPLELGISRVDFRPVVEGISDLDVDNVTFDISVTESKEDSKKDLRQHEDKVLDTDDLHLWVSSVGHGDFYVMITPSEEVVVFDTAHPNRANVVLSLLGRLGVDKIDHLILTHPHWDHIGGAPYIMDNYYVDNIYINGEGYPYDTYARLAQYFKADGSNVKIVTQGDLIRLNSSLRIEFLNPAEQLSEISEDDEQVNNNSLVSMIKWQDQSILLPADIYAEATERIMNLDVDLTAQVLALPHHGTNGFGDIETDLLDTVSPLAVIKSSDWNEWRNETSEELLKYLDENDILLVSTAVNGELEFVMQEDGFSVESGNTVWRN